MAHIVADDSKRIGLNCKLDEWFIVGIAQNRLPGMRQEAFFRASTNRWVQEETRVATWQERLFELVRLGDGYIACKGGTGTLVELAVVWEMLNKSVISGKPMVVLGEFWSPILDRVREVELGHPGPWGEANGKLVHTAVTPTEAASFLQQRLA